jgi:hypothetical protein
MIDHNQTRIHSFIHSISIHVGWIEMDWNVICVEGRKGKEMKGILCQHYQVRVSAHDRVDNHHRSAITVSEAHYPFNDNK